MISNLQLKDYRLLKLMLEANESFVSGNNQEIILDIDCDFDIYRTKRGSSFKVPLNLAIKAKKNRKFCSIRRIEISIEGIFELASDTPKEMISDSVLFNSLVILYGITRGIIGDITGNIQGGKFIVPSINFNEMIRKKGQKSGDEA